MRATAGHTPRAKHNAAFQIERVRHRVVRLRHLRRFNRIASQKYRAGSYSREVRVLAVSITPDDLAEAR